MSLSFHFVKYARPNLKLFNNYFEILRRISLGRSTKCKKESESSDKNKKKNDQKNVKDDKAYPDEPTACCMSGCANCVWIEYAEKLTEYYKDGGEQALKEIEEKVTDPKIKAFIHHELRMRNIKPK